METFTLFVYLCFSAGFQDGGISCDRVAQYRALSAEDCAAMQKHHEGLNEKQATRFRSMRVFCVPEPQ